MSNLENLFYLEVSGSGLSEMPKGMHKLKQKQISNCNQNYGYIATNS